MLHICDINQNHASNFVGPAAALQAQKALRAAVRKDGADGGGEEEDPGVEDQDRALREEAESEEEKAQGKKGQRKGTGRGRGQKKKKAEQGEGKVDSKKKVKKQKTEDPLEKKDAEAEASREVPKDSREAAIPAPSTPQPEEGKKGRVPNVKVRMTPTKKTDKVTPKKKRTPKGKKSVGLTGQARLNWFSSIAVQMH